MSAPVVVRYQARSGVRFVIVWEDEVGWTTPSASPGCHTYQSRRVADVVSYAIRHSPGVRTYATRASCRRALGRAWGHDMVACARDLVQS